MGVVGIPVREFQYRPDWALPRGPKGLTAAPVVGFSRLPVAPGETVRAVITPLWPQSLPVWRAVQVGDVLRMREGARVCGLGTVLHIRDVVLPLAEGEVAAIRAWLGLDFGDTG